jgi:single-stranded-DNA-specific exonuclease
MCSAGVAFYLCAALRTRVARTTSQAPPDPRAWLDLVALGTVCDMVPLLEENHVLVRQGLERMQARERPGLRALLHRAGVDPVERVDEEHLAFRLGPRLNAPGRMGEAEPALVLLRARSTGEAMALAEQVETLNQRRKTAQARVVAEAQAMVEEDPGHDRRAGLVVAHEGWPAGVVGIAAADLVERHGRPAVVLAIDAATGEARGSARTSGGLDVYQALRACDGLLTRCGGHPQAAGLTLPASNVEALAEAFDRAVASQGGDMEGDDAVLVDGTPDLSRVDDSLLHAIDGMGPFGVGFPPPLYLCEQAVVDGARVLKGSHLSLVLRQGKATHEGIAFRQADAGVERGDQVGFLYRPRFNTFRGRRRIQLDIKRIWRV